MRTMAEYNRYCPISMGSDVIADRWTPLIVRELVLGNTRFNDIARGLPGISRSLLVRRLGHLERAGVIERWPSPSGKGNEYLLTSAGRDLEQVLMTLGRWSVEWLYAELRPRDIDATTLMWWMHRLVVPENLPTGRVVVEFVHTAPRPAHDLDGDRPGRGVGVHAAPRLRLRPGRDVPDDRAVGHLQRGRLVGPRGRRRHDPARRPAAAGQGPPDVVQLGPVRPRRCAPPRPAAPALAAP